MGTMFPARLEEWDNAKSQGAFFVEQHVVQTLIESGKTPDPGDPATQEKLQDVQRYIQEEDPTAVSMPPIEAATAVGPPPVAMPTVQMRVATPSSGNPRAPTPSV